MCPLPSRDSTRPGQLWNSTGPTSRRGTRSHDGAHPDRWAWRSRGTGCKSRRSGAEERRSGARPQARMHPGAVLAAGNATARPVLSVRRRGSHEQGVDMGPRRGVVPPLGLNPAEVRVGDDPNTGLTVPPYSTYPRRRVSGPRYRTWRSWGFRSRCSGSGVVLRLLGGAASPICPSRGSAHGKEVFSLWFPPPGPGPKSNPAFTRSRRGRSCGHATDAIFVDWVVVCLVEGEAGSRRAEWVVGTFLRRRYLWWLRPNSG